MLNMRLIEAVVKIVVDYNEAEHIYESSKSIRKRAIDWYNHSDITEPKALAAMVMTGNYRYTPWNEVCDIKAFFFPEDGYDEYIINKYTNDNFSVGEIEMAEHDDMWR